MCCDSFHHLSSTLLPPSIRMCSCVIVWLFACLRTAALCFATLLWLWRFYFGLWSCPVASVPSHDGSCLFPLMSQRCLTFFEISWLTLSPDWVEGIMHCYGRNLARLTSPNSHFRVRGSGDELLSLGIGAHTPFDISWLDLITCSWLRAF